MPEEDSFSELNLRGPQLGTLAFSEHDTRHARPKSMTSHSRPRLRLDGAKCRRGGSKGLKARMAETSKGIAALESTDEVMVLSATEFKTQSLDIFSRVAMQDAVCGTVLGGFSAMQSDAIDVFAFAYEDGLNKHGPTQVSQAPKGSRQ